MESAANATTQVYEAVFHDGAFCPIQPASFDLAEGQQVRLMVEIKEKPDVLDLAADVYAGLSPDDVRELEQIALDRRDFFGQPPAR